MKSTKKSLFLSMVSLILCFAMLLGTTWAWFTDEVTSGVNIIKAGNLDVELYHGDAKVDENTKLFGVELWEPGVIAYENFTVKNVGNLALKYQLSLTIGDKNATVDGNHSLDEVLKAALVPGGFDGDRATAQALDGYTSLSSFSVTGDGSLAPATEGDTFGVVIYWQPNDNAIDNLYNLKNGAKATAVEGKFTEDALGIEIGIKLTATQLPYEEDSFDKFYDLTDDNVTLPDWDGESAEATIKSDEATTLEVKVDGETRATAEIPAATKIKTAADGEAKELGANETVKLTVEPSNTPDGVKVDAGESVTTYDVSLIKVVTTEVAEGDDIKEETKITAADSPVLVSLDIGVVDLVDFYHHGTKLTKVDSLENVKAEGEYFYNVNEGMVYFLTKSFSPFATVYKFAGGLGTVDHPYLLGNGGHWVGMCSVVDLDDWDLDDDETIGKTAISTPNGEGTICFKLISDIDMAGITLPETYGIFGMILDGDGHKVFNIVSDGDIFGSYGLDYENESVIKNIEMVNCETRYATFGYGPWGATSATITFDNVKITGGSTGSGAFLFYLGGAAHKAIFNNCTVNGITLTGGSSMGMGGYVGQAQPNTSVEVNSCKFGGMVTSSGNALSGFATLNGGTAKITNSEITSDAVLKNTGTGGIYAFASSLAAGSENNVFNGQAYAAKESQLKTIPEGHKNVVHFVSASDFTFEDGVLTYTGPSGNYKVVVSQMIPVSGWTPQYNTILSSYDWPAAKAKVTENVTTNTVIAFDKIVGVYNVVEDGQTGKAHMTTTDSSALVDEYSAGNGIYNRDNIAYINSFTEKYTGYYYIATDTLDGRFSDKVTVKMLIEVFDGNVSVGTARFSYNVPVSE